MTRKARAIPTFCFCKNKFLIKLIRLHYSTVMAGMAVARLPTRFRVALAQMCSTADIEANFRCRKLEVLIVFLRDSLQASQQICGRCGS